MRRFLLLIGDIAVLYAALITTLIVRYRGGFADQLDFHLLPFSIMFAVWILVFYISNLYELNITKNNLSFFITLFYSLIANTVISILFFYLVPFYGITPKRNLFIFLGIVLLLLNGWRRYFNKVISQKNENNNTLIIGKTEQSEELHEFLKENPQLGYRSLGILNTDDKNALGVLEDLVREQNVRTVVLCPSSYNIPKIIDVLYKLLGLGINFYSLSDFYEMTTGRIPLGAINQTWFIENLSEGNKGVYESIKRLMDVVFSILLGVVFVVFLPLVAFVIKIDSRGPVFYHQKRIGKRGSIFELIKFRTMRIDAEKSGPVWAKVGDTRVTRVGRILRRTRIDELPQLWNVLKGEMSFVGPRPERPEFHLNLKKEIPFYEERYLIKPGLTGWAQIRYRYSRSVDDTFQKLQYDLYYIKNRSIPLDLGIVLKTISEVLRSSGS